MSSKFDPTWREPKEYPGEISDETHTVVVGLSFVFNVEEPVYTGLFASALQDALRNSTVAEAIETVLFEKYGQNVQLIAINK
jgi:hypothetical protein